MPAISASVICRPSCSAAIIAESRSSSGFRRRASMSGGRYANSSAEPCMARSTASGSSGLMRTNMSDHSRKLSRSSTGTPSISAITVTGNGPANDGRRSSSALGELVEELSRGGADGRLHLGDRTRGERPGDEATELVMTRRIHHDHHRHRLHQVRRADVALTDDDALGRREAQRIVDWRTTRPRSVTTSRTLVRGPNARATRPVTTDRSDRGRVAAWDRTGRNSPWPPSRRDGTAAAAPAAV